MIRRCRAALMADRYCYDYAHYLPHAIALCRHSARLYYYADIRYYCRQALAADTFDAADTPSMLLPLLYDVAALRDGAAIR